jgi:hypothetical protein
MSSLTQTESAPRLSHARAYLAGTGATGALIAGAAIVLLSLAGILAVKGMPFGGSGSNAGSAYVGAKATGPAATAATALAAAPGAVAAVPVPGAPVGAGLPVGGPGNVPGTSPTSPANGPTSPGIPPTDGPGPPTTPTGSPGALTNTAGQVDQTLCSQGACTGISDQTDGTTNTVDGAVTNGLNRVGGAVGNDHLGNDVNGTANDAVNGLLGGGR